MGIALSGRDLGVTEQPADHREIQTRVDTDRGVGVSKVVDADVLELSLAADPRPDVLKRGPVAAGLGSDDDVGVVFDTLDIGQDLECGRVEHHGALARLRVGQVEAAPLEVDVGPPQGQDLCAATAGEDQETDRGDGVR